MQTCVLRLGCTVLSFIGTSDGEKLQKSFERAEPLMAPSSEERGVPASRSTCQEQKCSRRSLLEQRIRHTIESGRPPNSKVNCVERGSIPLSGRQILLQYDRSCSLIRLGTEPGD